MSKILIITGPTASGKTDFAILCAKKFNGEIISADSMQIYRHLNIGTAKATTLEQSKVPHHLIDILEPNEEFSVQQFVEMAQEKISEISKKSKLPIIVGGTGLYIKSLIYPYSFGKTAKNEQVRERFKSILKEKGNDFLFELLQKKSVEMAAKIHKNDTKRVIRALEILSNNAEESAQLKLDEGKTPRYDHVLVALDFPREELYDRINRRVEKMFEEGHLNEVRSLVNAGKIDQKHQSMQGIGYKELFSFFAKQSSLEQTKELIKKNTRNYAKRQFTFFRGMQNVIWLNLKKEGTDGALNLLEEKLKYLREKS